MNEHTKVARTFKDAYTHKKFPFNAYASCLYAEETHKLIYSLFYSEFLERLSLTVLIQWFTIVKLVFDLKLQLQNNHNSYDLGKGAILIAATGLFFRIKVH